MIFCKAMIDQQWRRGVELLFSSKALPLRFICTGGTCACIQLGLLQMFVHSGCRPIIANTIAFLVSAQVNFLFSNLFTWHDRCSATNAKRAILGRWLAFHCSISGSALLNLAIFTLAHLIMPDLLSCALGIIIAAILNFTVMNRFIFRVHARDGKEVLLLEPVEAVWEE
ncbi:GtrA family protein [Dictyobacter halimunensis]|uniref:GtrA family protein n=1 Tax=Dictyobacter halimunensis TaxID=3026934 RepID=UPI0030C69669